MNRSPYYSPLGRAADMDVGGAADLQTDIMRFMAILALCLVAIFALVQSIPLEPMSTPVAETRTPQRDEPIAVPTPDTKLDPAPLKKIDPAPLTPTSAKERPPKPARKYVAATPKPTPAPAPAPAPTTRIDPVPLAKIEPAPLAEPEGFSLRFASDTALTRLVARNEIGLYAIAPDRALRMSMNRGTPSFWPASAPNQYHEMDPATVPDQVITALRRAGTLGLNPQVKWGVTLPAAMRRQLDGYLAEHTGGELVIEQSGKLRLER